MKRLFTLLAFVVTIAAMSQSVAISDDGSVADGSAILDVKSTTKGFLPPRMTSAQRDAVLNPVAGLQIWCTDCVAKGAMYFYTGSEWSNGGTGITSGQAANIITNNGKTSDINHVLISSTADLVEDTNLYYTETRVSANTDVSRNKTNIASETARVNDQAALIIGLHAQIAELISDNTLVSRSVAIGTQKWMKKNLDVATYTDGTTIPEVADQRVWAELKTGAWCYYNNDSANETTYGKLYNWYAVMGITVAEDATPTAAQIAARKQLAPIGWHVPSHEEWTTSTAFLGGNADSAGGKMKETGTAHWRSPNTAATNSSGFTGLPGGYRNTNGTFNYIGYYGNWWSSTEFNTLNAWYRYLSYNNGDVFRNGYNKTFGFSVRCLRD